jgi:large subunit ribosomal protein L11
MAKKIDSYIKLVIPAGKANPAPPIGSALGQKGVNIMEFCKAFNAATQKVDEPGMPVPTVITVYVDKSFTFITKAAPVSYFLKKAAKISKGSGEVGKVAPIAKVTMSQVKEIAEKKMQDLNANDIDAASQMIIGSAKSMGIEVVIG